MKFDPQKHHRRSIRLKGYDYTQAGAYFITLVTHQREFLFGEVVDGEVVLNDWGNVAFNEWRRLERRFVRVVIDEFVVMPNHVHGIVWITEPESGVGVGRFESGVGAGQENSSQSGDTYLAPPLQASLGTIIGAYKSTTARLINGLRRTPGAPLWQRNYYERIVRDEKESKRIHAYIGANPANWEDDEENR